MAALLLAATLAAPNADTRMCVREMLSLREAARTAGLAVALARAADHGAVARARTRAIEYLRHDDPDVRLAAALLARTVDVAPQGERALNRLVERRCADLLAGTEDERRCALLILDLARRHSARRIVAAHLPRCRTVLQILDGLALVDRVGAAEAAPAMKVLMRHRHARVRRQALETLVRVGARDVAAAALQELASSPTLGAEARAKLERLDPPERTVLFEVLLDEPSSGLVIVCGEGMGVKTERPRHFGRRFFERVLTCGGDDTVRIRKFEIQDRDERRIRARVTWRTFRPGSPALKPAANVEWLAEEPVGRRK